jgi:hypothetical protein
MRWVFEPRQFLRSLNCAKGYSRQQNKQQGGSNKRTAPNPVLNQPWMASTSRQIQSELTERSKVRV